MDLKTLIQTAEANGMCLRGIGATSEGDFLNLYFTDLTVRGLRSKTIDCYRERISYLMRYALQIQGTLLSITSSDIRSYIIENLDRVSRETINGRIRVWKTLYGFAYKHGFVQANPMLEISLLKHRRQVPGILSIDQIQGLLRSFPRTYFGTRNALICRILYDGCVRSGELCNLTLGDYDRQKHSLIARGKSPDERIVFITTKTSQAIDRHLSAYRPRSSELYSYGPNSPLFPDKQGNPLRPENVGLMVRRQSYKIGFRVYPHLLRHTGATHLHERGMDIEMLRLTLGHASCETTKRYVSHNAQAIKSAHDRFSMAGSLL